MRVPIWVFPIVIAIFVACFLAWRDEYRAKNAALAALEELRSERATAHEISHDANGFIINCGDGEESWLARADGNCYAVDAPRFKARKP